MKNNYIKMNSNEKYLSLGNLFNLIKDISENKSTAMQLEIFYAMFNNQDVNKTTVNNYCTGYRAISVLYKQIYIDLSEKYEKDKYIFIGIVTNILSILNETIYQKDKINLEIINNNKKLKLLCERLYLLAKSDVYVSELFLNKVNKLYEENNLYECLINYLIYTVLENKQPRYEEKIKITTNKEEIDDYLRIKLYEGISYITSLKELAKKNNMYANAELGSLEFSGLITGNINYEESYNYYLESAKKDHPKGCWMVANLILTNKVNKDFNIAWEYLNKAIKLGSISALNTMGNCYLNGNNPEKTIDKNKATKYYEKASEYGYVFALNNLGKIYEKTNPEKSINYYKLSADLNNSWALNRVGEYYRKNNDLDTAYIYYKKAIESPYQEVCYYAYYNLAKYYYLENDPKKAKEYLIIADENNVKEAVYLLNDKFNMLKLK